MAAPTITLSNGDKMPTLGLGTWEAADADELETALEAALECGYRHIDTAWIYENENVIGKVLSKWLTSGKLKREELFITTKLPFHGIHPDRVEKFMKESLSNLQLDYVDLYLIHFPVGAEPIKGNKGPINEKGVITTIPTDHVAVWKKMEEQVDAGRARSIGLSNFTVKQISNVLKSARIKPANLQIEIHVFFQQNELVDFCKKNDISVVAYSPIGSPGYNKFLIKLGQPTKEMPDIFADATILQISKKHSKSPAQIALRFLIERGLGAIPKSVTPARLKQNIDIFDFTLDAKDMKELKALGRGEEARVCDFKALKGLETHPEFPIPL